eukprot:TRINITY_DN111962_c0_g1_i1.p1 TRINITY_DN111962_c0_g1~~TRINITY_DN111962_c0_g1_i1.p1  ORF type:complete len:494 (+),score=90.41 TRINITY_DN111962_c0_g1_i1:72-1553(+)
MGNGQCFRKAQQIYSDWSADDLRTYTRVWSVDPQHPDRYTNHHRFDKFRTMQEATRPVWAVAVAEVNLVMAAATSDHEVHLWDLETMELKVTLRGHAGQVWDVKFATNETTLASCSSDMTIRLWETATGSPLGVLRGHEHPIRCLAFSYAGYLISGDEYSNLFLWEAENACPIKEWKAHEGSVHSVAFSLTDPAMALSIGEDGSVASWFINREDEEIISGGRFAGGDGGAVLSIATHPIYRGVVCVGNQDGGVWIWMYDFTEKEPQEEGGVHVTGHIKLKGHSQAVWFVEFSKDGCLLASGSADCTVRVWDVTRVEVPTLTAVFRAHESWVKQVRWFTEPGKGRGKARLLVTCSTDGSVSIWAPPGRIKKIRKLEERTKAKQKLLDLDGLEDEEREQEQELVPFGTGDGTPNATLNPEASGSLLSLTDKPEAPSLPPPPVQAGLSQTLPPAGRGQPPPPASSAPRRGADLGPVNQGVGRPPPLRPPPLATVPK